MHSFAKCLLQKVTANS